MAKKESLDDAIQGVLRQEDATSRAVTSLISVKEKEQGKIGSDIEIKTDLETDKEVCVHSIVDFSDVVLNMNEEIFRNQTIAGIITTIKERKLLSKGRKSRMEIVEISRQPDMNLGTEQQKAGFLARMFSSRKPE